MLRYKYIHSPPSGGRAELAEVVEVALDGRGDDVGEGGVRTGRSEFLQPKPVFQIRIDLNTDPDPAF